jgi:hypothetical protein
MLKVSFELLANSPTSDRTISGYAMGHMSLSGAYGDVSSKNMTPPKTMMIFLSIVDLLDGLRRLICTSEEMVYNLIGTDTSFSVFFEKIGNGIRISANGSIIDQCPADCVATAVIEGVDLFLASAPQPDEPALTDLVHSIADFREMLNRMKT